jgi:hypothetical protein
MPPKNEFASVYLEGHPWRAILLEDGEVESPLSFGRDPNLLLEIRATAFLP